MTDQEIGNFTDYLTDLCGFNNPSDRQIAVNHVSEFLKDLRAAKLEDAKDALRSVLKTGKASYNPAKILGQVLGVLDDRRAATTSKYREYIGEPEDAWREEEQLIADARPAWDKLKNKERDRWIAEHGYPKEQKVPTTWNERKALIAFAKSQQPQPQGTP